MQLLITGSSGRIGAAAVEACVLAGHTVIATMRDVSRGEELFRALQGRHVHFEQLDVAASDAGEKVRELLLKYGPVEALVNNASMAVCGAFEEQSERDVFDQLETNVLGMMAVTRALLPSMRAAGSGRIISVSGIAGRVGVPALAPYAATKHALAGFCDALRHEVAPFGIAVCVVEVGSLRTPVPGSYRRRGELTDAAGPYAPLTRAMERLLRDGSVDVQAVGRRIVQLVTEPSPPFRTTVGGPALATAALRNALPDALFASGLRRLMGL
jgi:NAD(P)-dependent dehydrogenase (short-subunit alcohol dehydrogenase family)